MSPSITTATIHILNILIGIFSIAILALVAHSVISTNTLSDSYPQDVKGTGRGLLFWPGIGGIVDMLLFELLWFLTPSSEHGWVSVMSNADECSSNSRQSRKRQLYWNGLLFVAGFIFARPFIVLMYTFIEWGQAVKGQVSVSVTSSYVTTETWSCAAALTGGYKDVGSVCKELRAARYLLIPEVVFGAVVLSVVIWMRMRMRILKGERSVEAAVQNGDKF
jgi:hypothetical protein